MPEFIFKNITFEQCGCLGKGKSGISWLVQNDQKAFFVIKQIHHEPCSYYQFGNKLEAEIHAYHTLNQVGISIPRLLDIDYSRELILKEYIDGPTIAQLVENAQMKPEYIEQMHAMAHTLYQHGYNIDYYPTNFSSAMAGFIISITNSTNTKKSGTLNIGAANTGNDWHQFILNILKA